MLVSNIMYALYEPALLGVQGFFGKPGMTIRGPPERATVLVPVGHAGDNRPPDTTCETASGPLRFRERNSRPDRVQEIDSQEGNMDSTNTAQPFAKRIAVGFSMALFGVVLVASTLGGLNAGSDDSLAAGKVRVAPENPPVTIGKPIVAPKIPVPVTTTAPVAATPVQAVTTPVPVTPAPVVVPGEGKSTNAGKVR